MNNIWKENVSKFRQKTGEICLTPGLRIRRGMSRKDILAMAVNWEDWIVIDGIPNAYRAMLNLPNKNMSQKMIFIVHFGILDAPLAFWSIVPWDLVDGAQKRREGKHTKILRKWFLKCLIPRCQLMVIGAILMQAMITGINRLKLFVIIGNDSG